MSVTEIPVPAKFLGVEVPEEIRKQWWRWEGAEWRIWQFMGQNNLFPPDQRFSVRLPPGMCQVHRQMWRDYRDMRFDPVSGNRWPGHPGSPFTPIGDVDRCRKERRREWDEKASEQMRQIEKFCLSGRSPQCEGERV
jgi:hypothetical protein